MSTLIRYWLDVCLLRAAPQDGPASRFILGIAVSCYMMVSVLVLTGSYGMLAGSQVALLELGLLAVFVAVLLYMQGKTARINQTLSAMTGAGTVLGLLALPLVFYSGPVRADESLPVLLSIAWLFLLFWNLLVSAHIMRHALTCSFAIGMGVSLLYMLISMQFVATLFPQLAGS